MICFFSLPEQLQLKTCISVNSKFVTKEVIA